MASLDDVPDHVLLEIFSFLPVKTLIKVTEVSDRWSSLIKSSQSTMKRLCLRIYFNQREKIEGSLPDGQHVNLSFFGLDSYSDLYDLIREKYAEPETFIRNIQFMYFFSNSKWVRNKFSLNAKPARVEWKNLKSLKFENGTFRDVKDFLSDKISKLELIDPAFNDDSLNVLLSAEQAVNYKELRISRTDIDEDKLVEVIKLKSLRVAEFDLKYLAENVSVLSALSRAYKWKTLKIKEPQFYPDIVKVIIESNPGVTKILFKDASLEDKYGFLTKIFTFLPNIEHLALPMTFDRSRKSQMQLAKLHTLEIEGIRYPIRTIELIKIACPNLKTLKIYWISGRVMKKDLLENILNSAEHLEELHLGSQSEADTSELSSEEVEVIKAKGKKLKKLTVFTSFPDKMQATLAGFNDTQIHATAWNRNYEKPEEMDEVIENRMNNVADWLKKSVSTCEFRF